MIPTSHVTSLPQSYKLPSARIEAVLRKSVRSRASILSAFNMRFG